MSRAWISEVLFLAALLAGALLLAVFLGHLSWLLLLALGIFLSRWLYQLYRLNRWLCSRRRDPPASWGVWGQLFDNYYRLRSRHHQSKKRLVAVIHEFREAATAMPDGILMLDNEFRILWYNQSGRALVGMSSGSDFGQPVSNLIRSPQLVGLLEAEGRADSVEIRSPVDSSRRLMLCLVPYGNNQHLLLIRDVTRLHRLQAMRRDFVANASHELRSPLTVLGGYLDSMGSDTAPGPEWQKPLAEMQAQCRRMNSLVNDLLELSRLETEEVDAPHDESVDTPALVRSICRDAALADNEAHPIDVKIKSEAKLVGVERELHSTFSNLVNNALNYSEKGSPVGVTWSTEESGDGVFEVSDHGIGIDSEHLPFITQRFYRVDGSRSRQKGGTGLGLAIVKHVLKRHGAALEVDSEQGKGSVFRCVFPASRIVE